MKEKILMLLSAAAIIYTIWYMHFGELTTNAGALSKTGLRHPVYFAIWGALTYTALHYGIFYTQSLLCKIHKYQYALSAIALLGMILTITCRFDYSLKAEYYLHCSGSLCFSALTGISVFSVFLINFKKSNYFKVFTFIIGLILICDTVLLLIYKETALIEAIPVLFGLIILPATALKYRDIKQNDKDFQYAS